MTMSLKERNIVFEPKMKLNYIIDITRGKFDDSQTCFHEYYEELS